MKSAEIAAPVMVTPEVRVIAIDDPRSGERQYMVEKEFGPQAWQLTSNQRYPDLEDAVAAARKVSRQVRQERIPLGGISYGRKMCLASKPMCGPICPPQRYSRLRYANGRSPWGLVIKTSPVPTVPSWTTRCLGGPLP